jgi:hypothetical protein
MMFVRSHVLAIPPTQPIDTTITPTDSLSFTSFTVEALVGTLRAARKQGKVEYEGEMLFQGVHDEVVIKVKEQKA